MYIVSMTGQILEAFNKWDVRSVARAERWIADHNMIIYKCETTIMGDYVITVRSK